MRFEELRMWNWTNDYICCKNATSTLNFNKVPFKNSHNDKWLFDEDKGFKWNAYPFNNYDLYYSILYTDIYSFVYVRLEDCSNFHHFTLDMETKHYWHFTTFLRVLNWICHLCQVFHCYYCFLLYGLCLNDVLSGS